MYTYKHACIEIRCQEDRCQPTSCTSIYTYISIYIYIYMISYTQQVLGGLLSAYALSGDSVFRLVAVPRVCMRVLVRACVLGWVGESLRFGGVVTSIPGLWNTESPRFSRMHPPTHTFSFSVFLSLTRLMSFTHTQAHTHNKFGQIKRVFANKFGQIKLINSDR